MAHTLRTIISQMSLKVKVIGQRSRSPRSKNVKIPVFSLLSEKMVKVRRVEVKVTKVKGQGQGQRS